MSDYRRELSLKYLEHIKSILTSEEYQEYQEEVAKMKPLKVKIGGVMDERDKEEIEAIQRPTVTKFLSQYADKQFRVLQEFYDYAMGRLYKTLEWSLEYPIVGVFKPENGRIVMQRFIDSEWLVRNGYAHPGTGTSIEPVNPLKPNDGNYYGSFEAFTDWDIEKFFALQNEAEQSGEYLIKFHTHPTSVNPSKGDFVVSNVLGIIGFETPTEELCQLATNSFLSRVHLEDRRRWKETHYTTEELVAEVENSNLPTYRKKIDIDRIKWENPRGQVRYQLQPYEIDSGLWGRIYRECRPTIALFAGYANQPPTRIQLSPI